ncbi:MAG TPA: MarR family transcriptional regulator [Pseudonocardiaceae bacterium]
MSAPIHSEAGSAVGNLSPEVELWSRLDALHARITTTVEKALHRRCSFGLSEFFALVALANAPEGELRMQELTDVTHLNQSSVSRLVARLERDGLAERRLCERDRRGVYTGITKQGQEALRDAAPVFENTLREEFTRLSVDPQLGPLLHRLKESTPDPA